jgi:tight adherence protein B
MSVGVLLAAGGAVGGASIAATGLLARAKVRDAELVQMLGVPYGETDVDVAQVAVEHGTVVQGALGLANEAIERLGSRDTLRRMIERADLSLRPSELVVIASAGGLSVGLLLAALTGYWWTALLVLLVTPAATVWLVSLRAARRAERFCAQLPDALGLIASSLTAGHTFLRSIQLMAEEFDDPIGQEFSRVVAEAQLGAPLVDALERMGTRLKLRDVDWMVQAIRIQQSVGGQLAALLDTLADFMRAREEVRREVKVLTAEGRISAWVLGAMPVFLFVAVQVVNPGYLDPMLRGWGLVWLAATVLAMGVGIGIILRMVKGVEV